MKVKETTFRKDKGITLIALVVTIIVLLILAGISISMLTGQNGILNRATTAKTQTEISQVDEMVKFSAMDALANGNGKITEVLLTEALNKNLGSGNYTLTGNETDGWTIVANEKKYNINGNGSITEKGKEISECTWQEINALAKEIAKDSTITKDTEGPVTKTINGKSYTATVGDKKTVTINEKDYIVRILGFNHDTLENGQTAYGDASITTAGISFEFETILFNSDLYQDGRGSFLNNGGWSNRELRTILNNGTATAGSGKINLYDIETAMRQSGIIKSVSKRYIDQKGSSYDASKATVEISNDKLWLLACSEVVNKGYTDGAYAYAATSEGSQYKYYVDSNIVWNSGNANLKKCNAGSTSPSWWWLRSPYYNDNLYFCSVNSGGYCGTNYAGDTNGVAPGFAI